MEDEVFLQPCITSMNEAMQVALCRLFSTAVENADVSQRRHIQGKVNVIHKLDHGFLASNDNINMYVYF